MVQVTFDSKCTPVDIYAVLKRYNSILYTKSVVFMRPAGGDRVPVCFEKYPSYLSKPEILNESGKENYCRFLAGEKNTSS
jgi:hypothetical protein